MPLRDVADHARLIALLARSVRRDTLPPSLLFAGPPGAGKRRTAVGVAQALNCLTPVTPDPLEIDGCGKCPACSRIERGIHPDILVVEPGDTGSIRIDQVREIVERSAYRPFEGRRRVVIVNEADAMLPAAQNAMLKTLEEPPPSSVFILMTARPDMLLPTVRSRCPQLRFSASNAEEIDPAALAIAANVLVHAAGHQAPAARLDAAKDLLTNTGRGGASDREQLASYLHAMAALLRDAELVATSGAARWLTNTSMRPAVERLAGTYRGDRGLQAFGAVDRALVALGRNAGVKIVADWVVVNL